MSRLRKYQKLKKEAEEIINIARKEVEQLILGEK